jgi:uncharacterized membrane protein
LEAYSVCLILVSGCICSLLCSLTFVIGDHWKI